MTGIHVTKAAQIPPNQNAVVKYVLPLKVLRDASVPLLGNH